MLLYLGNWGYFHFTLPQGLNIVGAWAQRGPVLGSSAASRVRSTWTCWECVVTLGQNAKGMAGCGRARRVGVFYQRTEPVQRAAVFPTRTVSAIA